MDLSRSGDNSQLAADNEVVKRRWWLALLGVALAFVGWTVAGREKSDPFVGLRPYVVKDVTEYGESYVGNYYWSPHSNYRSVTSGPSHFRVRRMDLKGIQKSEVVAIMSQACSRDRGWDPPKSEDGGLVWFGCEMKPPSKGASVHSVAVVGPMSGRDDGSHEIELAEYVPLTWFDVVLLRVKALGRNPFRSPSPPLTG